MSHDELQRARSLINALRYDEARAILETLDDPTAKQWLEKLDQIAPRQQAVASVAHPKARQLCEVQPTVAPYADKTTSRSNAVTMMLLAIMLLVTFGMAIYAAFLRPVGVSAAEIPQVLDVSKIVEPKLAEIDTQLNTFQTNLDNRLAAMEKTAVQVGAWEYLTVNYSQFDTDFDGEHLEIVYSDSDEYNNTLFLTKDCGDNEDCREKQAKGRAYYLNSLGEDGWEIIDIIDHSDQYTYSVEIVFKRPK